MVGIYKITSPSGKIYIGKSIRVEERIGSYKYVGSRINQPKLNNSIVKYGIENHVFEIIEECNEEQLNEREIYWIDFYNSTENGLNVEIGGEGGRRDQTTKNKISRNMMGQKRSTETREKMRNSKINHEMYNDEWRAKMKETTWKSGTCSKIILQYDLEGNFIREWKSLSDACEALTGNRRNTGPISNALTEKSKTSYGYIWKFKN